MIRKYKSQFVVLLSIVATAVLAYFLLGNRESKLLDTAAVVETNLANPAPQNPLTVRIQTIDPMPEQVAIPKEPALPADQENNPTLTLFETVDPALIDDSIVLEKIGQTKINRYRVVNVNSDQLRASMTKNGEAQDIYLPLFDDLIIMGNPSKTQEYHDGPRAGYASWSGSINGDGKSMISVIIGPSGRTLIKVYGNQGSYDLSRLTGTPFHILLEYTPKEFSFDGDTG